MSRVNNSITVFEYGYLGDEVDQKKSSKIKWISSAAFTYLKELCLCADSESGFVRLKMIEHTEVLQTQNYAGVVLTPDGTQIEILPKIGRGTDEERLAGSREALLLMLATLGDFRHLKTESASIEQQKMPLLEVFIRQFLDSVNHLVKRGLRSDYSLREDNLLYLKGKLQVGKQLRHNLINRHRFHVEFEEYLPDRPANRLIHSALICIKRYILSLANQRLQQELVFAFDDVPLSQDHAHDFKRLRLDRGMAHYETPLSWAKLILNAFSPLTMQGQHSATSLLFPMEAVFESYVAAELTSHMRPDFKIETQARSCHLVKHGDKHLFQLRPDILIRKGPKRVYVMDTKWKMVSQSKENGTGKYRLAQADLYQMFAYGHNYLGGEGDIYLIYPYQEKLTAPEKLPFEFTDQSGVETKLRLWLVPFKIQKQGGELLLPQPREGLVLPIPFTNDVCTVISR